MTFRIIQTTVLLLILSVTVYSIQTSEFLFNKGLLSQHSFYAGHANPAFLHARDYLTVKGAYAPSLNKTFQLLNVAVSTPINEKQSAGITILRANSNSPIYPAVWDGSTNSIFVDSTTSFEDDVLHIIGSYSYALIDRLSFGTNLTVLKEEYKSGFGLSLGANFRMSNHPFARTYIGLNYANVISPSFKYKTARVLPAGLTLHTRGEFVKKIINFDFELKLQDYPENSGHEHNSVVDSDGNVTIINDETLTLDYNMQLEVSPPFFSLFFLFGNDHIGVAGGTNIPYAKRQKRIQLTYEYTNILGDSDIAYFHTISFLGEFGPARRKQP